MNNPIHPRIAELSARSEALRDQLCRLLETQAGLIEHTAPYLEAVYLQTLGRAEYTLLEARARNACLRRRIEMTRALLDRGENLTPRPAKQAVPRHPARGKAACPAEWRAERSGGGGRTE